MEYKEFEEKFEKKSQERGLNLKKDQISQLFSFMNLLIEWNQKMDLTNITDPDEIILKHFVDSLTLCNYIEGGKKVIDLGTGAGFPGIPLAIQNKQTEFVLADALQKRINFLEEVKKELNLSNVTLIHGRAEDLGQDKEYRECFDIAVSRAVAPLNVLLEYMLPFVKIGGDCLCMKGSKKEEAQNALEALGGEIEEIEEFFLPDSDMKRMIYQIRKVSKTPEKYPRKAGKPAKQPL